MAGLWTRARFNQEYLPGLESVMVDSYINKRHDSMWGHLVTKKTSKKGQEKNLIRSGLGLPELLGDGAPVDFDVQIQGPIQYWTHLTYALAVRLHENAIEDNLYELNGGGDGGNLKEIFYDLGEAFAENEEVLMARFFNSGTATTYHSTRFSKALFAADHSRLDGSTFSNLATSADLTYLTFWANVVAAENQVNHRGHKIKKQIKALWYPPQLERAAIEVLKSSDRPDTTDRAISALANSGRSISQRKWSHMTDEDMWVMQLDGKGIDHYTRRKQRFARDKDFHTGDVMIKGDQRWSAEINDEQCYYANVPA